MKEGPGVYLVKQSEQVLLEFIFVDPPVVEVDLIAVAREPFSGTIEAPPMLKPAMSRP